MRALLEHRAADRLAAAAAERFAGQSAALAGGCGLPAESIDQFEEFARYVANRPS
jgi:hypothetical protein